MRALILLLKYGGIVTGLILFGWSNSFEGSIAPEFVREWSMLRGGLWLVWGIAAAAYFVAGDLLATRQGRSTVWIVCGLIWGGSILAPFAGMLHASFVLSDTLASAMTGDYFIRFLRNSTFALLCTLYLVFSRRVRNTYLPNEAENETPLRPSIPAVPAPISEQQNETPSPPATQAVPAPVSQRQPEVHVVTWDIQPRLWSPSSAANASLLLYTAFGAYLHAANWRELGKPERALVNMRWFWTSIAVLGLNAILICFPTANQVRAGFVGFMTFGMLLVWYFTVARSQIKYVRDRFGKNYIRKRHLIPELIGLTSIASYLALVMFLGSVFNRPDPSELAAAVRPLILQEWHKHTDTQGATIQQLTLVHKSGNAYSGVLDASLDGESVRFFVEVTADGQNIIWKLEDPSQ